MTQVNWRPSKGETFYYIGISISLLHHDQLVVMASKQGGIFGMCDNYLNYLAITDNLFHTEAEALRALADGLEKMEASHDAD